MTGSPTLEKAKVTTERVHVGDPVHNSIVEFLYDEAHALDDERLDEWVAMLAEDLVYQAPVRVTRNRDDGPPFSETMFHFDDDHTSIAVRVHRLLRTSSGWAENPPSRVRRLVGNVIVHATSDSDEYAVTSALIATRSRMDGTVPDVISAERRDVVRRTPDGWRLARRQILLDHTILGTSNLAVFL
jgi:3-phenylpropionate/cinnamic acid dioxygenase small subunit